MPIDPGGASESPTVAAQTVRNIKRLIAQRRFDEAAGLALRALRGDDRRRDVRLLLVRALIGAKRHGEAADEALQTLALFPRDVAARTLLRTAIGRLHLAVRNAVGRIEQVATPDAPPTADDIPTARHEPFGGGDDPRARGPLAFAAGRRDVEIRPEDMEETVDEEPIFGP